MHPDLTPRLDQPQLVVHDLHRRGGVLVAQGQRARAGQRQPGQDGQRLGDAARLVQQVPDGQVRRQAGLPVAAEHQVQPDGQAVAVHAEVAEQPAEAQHQDPARCVVEPDVEDRDLVVQVAVQVHGLGQHRPAARARGAAGVGRAVAGRGHPLEPDDLAPDLEQHRLLTGDPGALGQPVDLLAQPRGGRPDGRAVLGQPGEQRGHRHRLRGQPGDAGQAVVQERAQLGGPRGAVPVADLERRAGGADEGEAIPHVAAPRVSGSGQATLGWVSSWSRTLGHSARSTL